MLHSLAVNQMSGPAETVRDAIARLPGDGMAALEAVSEWPDVDASAVLLAPEQCCGAWRQFLTTANAMVQQARAAYAGLEREMRLLVSSAQRR